VTSVTVVPERPLWRRVAGALLVAYGIGGLLLVAGGGILVASSVARLDGLAATLETQRLVLVRSLDATGTFLRDARSGTGNVQTSLVATTDSARQTATLTRSLATAMEQLAAASGISILGSQPFAGLADTFTGVARQASAMGTSLDATAASLAVNGSDLQQVREDLGAIQTEIDELRRQVSGTAIDASGLDAATRALEASRIVLFGLLVWLAVQAVIAITIGLALARWTTEIPRAGVPQVMPPD
jgi:prophage DNA circulation protein